jgi:hypothetical protein
MVDRSAPAFAGDSGAFGSEPRPRAEAVTVLEQLLAQLFPAPPSLDCITIDDVLRRYRLTGLGAPALTAIEQSQRIVRARGDYGQTGLCEFHVGLVYFNWEDYRAAANQFALARQPWTLAGDHSANCLTHFAQGLALYHAYHNEPAMLQFGRTERLLARAPHGTAAPRHARLAEALRPLLVAAQEALREALWPEDRVPEPAGRGYLSVPPLRAQPRPEDDGVAVGRPAAPPVERLSSSGVFARAARPPERPGSVALPISNLPGGLGSAGDGPTRGPVPGHIIVDDRYTWYTITERHGAFLPTVETGMWLLADNDVDERPSEADYVIIGSRQAGLGSITVQPVSYSSLVPYCYLGYRLPEGDARGESSSRLFVDETQQPVVSGDLLVLAVVVGLLARLGASVGRW